MQRCLRLLYIVFFYIVTVMIMPYGDWDIRAYIDSGGTRRQFDQHQGQMWEQGLAAVEKVEATLRKPRKDPVRYVIVCDLGRLEYRQLASVTCKCK